MTGRIVFTQRSADNYPVAPARIPRQQDLTEKMDIDHNFIGLSILRKQVPVIVEIPFSNSPYGHDEG